VRAAGSAEAEAEAGSGRGTDTGAKRSRLVFIITLLVGLGDPMLTGSRLME
jgi:hypothetical protein